jgi:hypothetical protein
MNDVINIATRHINAHFQGTKLMRAVLNAALAVVDWLLKRMLVE